MRTRSIVAASCSLSLVAGIYACQDTFTNPVPVFNPDAGPIELFDVYVPSDASNDATLASDAPSDAHVDSSHDAGPDTGPFVLINGCDNSSFGDASFTAPDASRLITFAFDASPMQYQPPCMRIAVGESVTWQGDFAAHPLQPFNGDPNTPIPTMSIGQVDASLTELTVEFPEAGLFGYQCAVHAPMIGAIQVQ